jgi:hypothetical protein
VLDGVEKLHNLIEFARLKIVLLKPQLRDDYLRFV